MVLVRGRGVRIGCVSWDIRYGGGSCGDVSSCDGDNGGGVVSGER